MKTTFLTPDRGCSMTQGQISGPATQLPKQVNTLNILKTKPCDWKMLPHLYPIYERQLVFKHEHVVVVYHPSRSILFLTLVLVFQVFYIVTLFG